MLHLKVVDLQSDEVRGEEVRGQGAGLRYVFDSITSASRSDRGRGRSSLRCRRLRLDCRGLEAEPNGAARAGGFSVHAGVVIASHQREKLERLCRTGGCF